MITQTISLTLFAITPTSVDVFADEVRAVDVTVSDQDAVFTAHDGAGEPIGSLALWVDEDGTTWIAADFEDGQALFGVSPTEGEVYRESDLGPEILQARLETILEGVDGETEKSWGECGWKAGAAAVGCALARPIMCVGGGIKAACACVPKLVKEFEPYECPWGL